jgi:predicted dehydrogenase
MKTLRWGLIGSGDISQKRVAPALRDLPNCDFVAVSRARFELAGSFAKEFGARKWYENWQELVDDKEIDAVYIATPVYLHAEQTIAAANSGKHVLCEKPMAMNPAECERMIEACQRNNVKLGVAYYRHFYPVIERIKNAIASGEIGDIVLAQINAFEFFNPPDDHLRYWLINKEKSGGGPMFDFGCHRLEVLVNLFGSVRQLKSLVTNVVFNREVEDTATVLMQFESGVCATLAVTHAAIEPQDTLDIFGTRGSIRIEVLNYPEIKFIKDGVKIVESHANAPNVHLPLIEDFVDAVFQDREPKVNGETGKTIAKLEEEIYSR